MAQSWPISHQRLPTPRRTSWQIHRAVVYALFLREMKTRFGSKRLGYVWAIVQPASFVLMWWGFFALALRGGRDVGMGVEFPMFLLTGFVPYGMFRSITGSSMNAFTANQGLFNYRQVKPIDTLFARCLVESIVHPLVFAILICLGSAIGFDTTIHNFLGLFLTQLLLVWFSFSLGLVFAVITVFSEMFPTIMGFVLTPLLFISGVIIPISSVPRQFRDILFLNPLLHFIELGRVNYFAAYESPEASYSYVLGWILITCFLGFWLYEHSKNRILMSS